MAIEDKRLRAVKMKVFALEHPKPETPDLNHEDLDVLSAEALKQLRASGDIDATLETFTCYRCSAALTCPYVYDTYNTGGDCLGDK